MEGFKNKINSVLPACGGSHGCFAVLYDRGDFDEGNIACCRASSYSRLFSLDDSFFYRTKGGIRRWSDGIGIGRFDGFDSQRSQSDVWTMCFLPSFHVFYCLQTGGHEGSDSVFTLFAGRLYIDAGCFIMKVYGTKEKEK